MRRHERLAIKVPGSDHLGDPAGAMPVGLDVLRSFFRPQRPADVTAMADLMIDCHERDLALSKPLLGDLPVERRWLALTVRRKSASCSVSCRQTPATCGGHPPGSARPQDPRPQAASGGPSAHGSHRWRSRPERSPHRGLNRAPRVLPSQIN